jgi:hypothetical protein
MKDSPEDILKEFINRLKECYGAELVSAILHGSAARADHDHSVSDLNVICVLRQVGVSELRKCSKVLDWWQKQKQPPPLFLSLEEINNRNDVFPIEYIDIQQSHRILFGEDVFSPLTIDRSNHRVELEHEVSSNLLRLRQRYLALHPKPKDVLRLMIESISTFGTLARHALILVGADAPGKRSETFEAAAKRFSLDAKPFLSILRLRQSGEKPSDSEIENLFTSYLDQITKLEKIVDQL